MSRTRKDSRRNARRDIEILRRLDGLFDVSYLGEVTASGITERTMLELLRIRFGFCGDES